MTHIFSEMTTSIPVEVSQFFPIYSAANLYSVLDPDAFEDINAASAEVLAAIEGLGLPESEPLNNKTIALTEGTIAVLVIGGTKLAQLGVLSPDDMLTLRDAVAALLPASAAAVASAEAAALAAGQTPEQIAASHAEQAKKAQEILGLFGIEVTDELREEVTAEVEATLAQATEV